MNTIYETMNGNPLDRIQTAGNCILNDIQHILNTNEPSHVICPKKPVDSKYRIEILGKQKQGLVISDNRARMTTGASSGAVEQQILEKTAPDELVELSERAEAEAAKWTGIRTTYDICMKNAITNAKKKYKSELKLLKLEEKQ